MAIIKARPQRRNLPSNSPPPTPEEMRNEPPIRATPISQVPFVEPPKKPTRRITQSQGKLKTKPMTKEEGPGESSNPLDTLAMAAETMTPPSSPRETHLEDPLIDSLVRTPANTGIPPSLPLSVNLITTFPSEAQSTVGALLQQSFDMDIDATAKIWGLPKTTHEPI
ncbi:hypothetical protein L6452_21888 [Arctium lappa]|uniref:Uncharacterized protein n=1 Tax=Arctium lappa TaxID=4217 RepID=A0ACB9AZK4_ARCLA|nr:hypothetical protein L6452_21888 [Arctium lappa]